MYGLCDYSVGEDVALVDQLVDFRHLAHGLGVLRQGFPAVFVHILAQGLVALADFGVELGHVKAQLGDIHNLPGLFAHGLGGCFGVYHHII